MAFDFMGPKSVVQMWHQHEGILELPKRYGESATFLPRIQAQFYASSRIAAHLVPFFQEEIRRLLRRRRAEIEPELRRTRKVYAQDKSIEERILLELLRQDALYSILEDLDILCEECVAEGADIQCEGD